MVWLLPPKLLVAAVILLNKHSSPPTLLELLLLMVAAKFTLDKDGGLRHLLIKCILLARNKNKQKKKKVFYFSLDSLIITRDHFRMCLQSNVVYRIVLPVAIVALPSMLSMLACKQKKG